MDVKESDDDEVKKLRGASASLEEGPLECGRRIEVGTQTLTNEHDEVANCACQIRELEEKHKSLENMFEKYKKDESVPWGVYQRAVDRRDKEIEKLKQKCTENEQYIKEILIDHGRALVQNKKMKKDMHTTATHNAPSPSPTRLPTAIQCSQHGADHQEHEHEQNNPTKQPATTLLNSLTSKIARLENELKICQDRLRETLSSRTSNVSVSTQTSIQNLDPTSRSTEDNHLNHSGAASVHRRDHRQPIRFPIQETNPGIQVILHPIHTPDVRSFYFQFVRLMFAIVCQLNPDNIRRLRRWAAQRFHINVDLPVREVFWQLDEITSYNLNPLQDFFQDIQRFDLVNLINEFQQSNYIIRRALSGAQGSPEEI